MLGGRMFVAHNARFDYGFLKHAFARLERSFTARVLCTVRLSRRLFPEAQGHGLDALIARHALAVADRHRALGDARALWAFVQALYRDLAPEAIDAAANGCCGRPACRRNSRPTRSTRCPEAPGVYLFYGLNALPLYIGKSVNLRERVGAHFSSDWRVATDLRLSAEIRRIEFEETAGELGALLREAALVKSLLPAHNHALRRKAESGVLELPAEPGPPRFVPAAGVEPGLLAGHYGPFASRATGARDAARTRRRSTGCAGRRWAWKSAPAPASRASCGAALARASARSRRTRITRGLPPRSRRSRFRGGPSGPRRDPRARAVRRAHRRARDSRLVLARHRARRRRARPAHRSAAARRRSTPTSRGCSSRRARGRHAHVLAALPAKPPAHAGPI